jgi:hypothetical protein
MAGPKKNATDPANPAGHSHEGGAKPSAGKVIEALGCAMHCIEEFHAQCEGEGEHDGADCCSFAAESVAQATVVFAEHVSGCHHDAAAKVQSAMAEKE